MAKPFCRKITNVGDINKLRGVTNDLVDFILTKDNEVYVRVRGAYKLITGGGGEKGEKGDPGKDGVNGKDGTSVSIGSVDKVDGVTTITFSDGTKVEIADGVKGDKGDPGENGVGISIGDVTKENGVTTITFSDGSKVEVADGAKGDKGDPGTPGSDGEPAVKIIDMATSLQVILKNGIVYFSGTPAFAATDTNKFRLAGLTGANTELLTAYANYHFYLPTVISGAMYFLKGSLDPEAGITLENQLGTLVSSHQLSFDLGGVSMVVDADKI